MCWWHGGQQAGTAGVVQAERLTRRCRARFVRERLDGLSDEPRPGVSRTITKTVTRPRRAWGGISKSSHSGRADMVVIGSECSCLLTPGTFRGTRGLGEIADRRWGGRSGLRILGRMQWSRTAPCGPVRHRNVDVARDRVGVVVGGGCDVDRL
ncbi:hypothetical protein EEJ42_39820 [Streptomyces botrytidirepellens]|uniref:Uncharacterized protein n=1 Tax=Streptomyces botrytidirepellens TaxID=2486417 RepID=A0A3M8TG35_9ACTN|nr:hypothetical protein EEJ42_39820 [Streptomyces botrytidirepellens]